MKLSLGVIVPCRNEAAVIGRKLANLAAIQWPDAERPHRVCIVDDGSEDRTSEIAESVLRAKQPFLASVIRNEIRPGKPGAIRAGIEALGDEVDLILLSDADVIFESAALGEVVRAFASEERLAMATGRQQFVDELPDDGVWSEARAGEARVAADLFDRATAVVRRVESRFGKLFSVHGQLLCWRASLGILPAFQVAADDLDLMLQVRDRDGALVRYLSNAVFLECKTPLVEASSGQALRRARAYFQALGSRGAPRGDSLLGRLQWMFYRYVPTWTPVLVPALILSLLVLAAIASGTSAVLVLSACVALALATPPGRFVVRLLSVIYKARKLEAREPMSERWEMARR